MAKRDDVFPTKYLKASDLNDKPLTVVIERAWTETMKSSDGKEQTKTILSFKGLRKFLPLNLTNWDSVANTTGEDDSDNWRGHAVELYPTTTQMRGETVGCIRVRPPAQRELPKAKLAPAGGGGDMDDEIPFAPEFR